VQFYKQWDDRKVRTLVQQAMALRKLSMKRPLFIDLCCWYIKHISPFEVKMEEIKMLWV